jgi:uncharacterized membrane protein YraQ (UPF0718 family)
MRMIFSLVGLLIVVTIVGLIAKKQLTAVTQLPNSTSSTATTTPANIAEQSKQMQTQVKDQLNEAMKATAEAREKALENGNSDKPVEKTGSTY